MKKLIAFFIIIFRIIVNVKCQQYIPTKRLLHTATLIEEKIYFLGGLDSEDKYLNDFFFIDLSKSIDPTKTPFLDLNVKASALPPHNSAAASPYNKDSIFLFGGSIANSFGNPSLAYSFNSSQLEWNAVTISQGNTLPDRKTTMNAVTDNSNKIYIFGGGFTIAGVYVYGTKMNIFDTVNKIWTISESGLLGRDGHTATFLPDTNDIIYIGGFGIKYLTTLDAYNTRSNSWRKVTTANPPEPRYGHSAALTKDGRIIVFGGSQATNIHVPVNSRYVVLNTKTSEWYIGTEDVSIRAPFRSHTATLFNDYMFIAFGVLDSRQLSGDVLIFKIGDRANFSLETSYDPTDPTVSNPTSPPSTSTSSTKFSKPAIIGISFGSVLILGIIGFFSFKKYKKYRHDNFIPTIHVTETPLVSVSVFGQFRF